MNFYLIDYMLVIMLAFSVYFDITKRKIPNIITMPAILIGIIWSTVDSGVNGFLFSIFGFLFGLAVFFIPYISGGIGAGDVKLMAAIGALKGWRFTLISTFGTAFAGGVIVIGYMIYKGKLISTLINTLGLIIKPLAKWLFKVSGNKKTLQIYQYFDEKKSENSNDYIPYAIAISIGVIVALFGVFEELIKI